MAGIDETLPRMTAAQVTDFLDREFPQMNHDGRLHVIEEVRPMGALVRLLGHERNLRPGGTLSGPAMMALADCTMYAALLGQIGPVALAVTTSMSINFLRKPAAGDLLADCSIIKLGRRLAVGEVGLRGDGDDTLVAHAVLTYSIPADA